AGARGPTFRAIASFESLGVSFLTRSDGGVRFVGKSTSSGGAGGAGGGMLGSGIGLPATPFGAPAAIQFLTSAILSAGNGSPPFGIRREVSVVSRRRASSL